MSSLHSASHSDRSPSGGTSTAPPPPLSLAVACSRPDRTTSVLAFCARDAFELRACTGYTARASVVSAVSAAKSAQTTRPCAALWKTQPAPRPSHTHSRAYIAAALCAAVTLTPGFSLPRTRTSGRASVQPGLRHSL
eukprot:365569-Chlamydomonas_euryale.AAC.12